MSSRRYFESLTILRGIAAWWIVLYHFKSFLDAHLNETLSSIISRGYLAVDLFFILSGFVIYYNYREINFQFKEVLSFMIKRFARIYPLHFLILISYLSIPLAYFLFSKFDNLPGYYGEKYYILSLLLVQNWGVTDKLAWNVPAWSISTEWFSYIIYPIFVCFLFRYFKSNIAKVVSFLGILVLIVLYFSGSGETSIGADIPKNGLIRCFLQFLLGVLICGFFIENEKLFESKLVRSFLILFSSVLLYLHIGYDINDYYVFSIIFSLLILFFATAKQKWDVMLRATPIYLLGEISYSTYMVHFIVREWFKLIFVEVDNQANLFELFFVLAFILVSSIFLYRLVERPAQTRVSNILLSWFKIDRQR